MAPLELRVPHSLGREEIHRRIDAGLARARSEYESQVGPIKAEWVDPDRMTVGLSVMGMQFDGQIEVFDNEVLVKVHVPGMASMFAGQIRKGIEERLGGLLAGPVA
jgi:hypothetical protein